MIEMYYGNVRQGKTFGAVIRLFLLWLDGYTIYSNTWLAFPFKPLTLDYILDIVEKDLEIPEDKPVFFLDELGVLLDSRTSMSKRNRIIGYFLSQSGKLSKVNTDYGLILIGTCQFEELLDRRLRKYTDKKIESEKFVYKGEKAFFQTITVYRGKKSYQYNNILVGSPKLYALYDTRKKIRYEKDRYSKDKDNINTDNLVVDIA